MGVFWSTGSDGIKLVGGQTLGRMGFSRAHFGGPNFLEIPQGIFLGIAQGNFRAQDSDPRNGKIGLQRF